MSSEFEQSLSNMSLKRPATAGASTTPRSLRTVTSSPQLLPLKQIYEESEIASGDEDAISVHSQTSAVRLRHSSLSMASPEVARKLLVRYLAKRVLGVNGLLTFTQKPAKAC